MKKFIIIASCVLAIVIAAAFYFKFYFVFGEGVKAGELNFVVYKGYIFKTYEGKAIQAGFNSKSKTATIQSYEFEFSITDPVIADSLMRCSGKKSLQYDNSRAVESGKKNSKTGTRSCPAVLYFCAVFRTG